MPEDKTEGARLRAGIRALVRRFAIAERADISCCGMTVAQAATLEALAQGAPVRLGDLGRTLGIRPSTLTRNLARLEERRLVERSVDPQDGRAARVGLTATGREAAAQVETQEIVFADSILAALPKGSADHTVNALESLVAAIRQVTESCCSGAFDYLMNDSSCRGSGEKE